MSAARKPGKSTLVQVNIKLAPDVYERLRKRARAAERTISAEVRVALNKHLRS